MCPWYFVCATAIAGCYLEFGFSLIAEGWCVGFPVYSLRVFLLCSCVLDLSVRIFWDSLGGLS